MTVVNLTSRVEERCLRFAAQALRDHRWQSFRIRGDRPGPRLCVMSGMHVNEVAGIAASRRLIAHFAATPFSGDIEILPIADPASLRKRAQHCTAVDGRNINFSFPGDPAASYAGALADALLNDWAKDADLLLDLHGGDLCERVTPFAVLQESGDAALDAANFKIAEAFDPEIIVSLPQTKRQQQARSCSARAWQGRRAGFFESGGHGLPDAADIDQHVHGVLRVAARLGMIDEAPPPLRSSPLLARRYHFVTAKRSGWCDGAVEPGSLIGRGGLLATISDERGRPLDELRAPESAMVLWRVTHPLVQEGEALFGLAGDLQVLP